MNLQVLFLAVALGIFAALIMDIGALLGFKAGLAGHGPRRKGFEFIGRWIGHLIRGQVRHKDILLTPVLTHERRLGLVAHYAAGIGLAIAYTAMLSVIGMVPSFLLGAAFGIVTVPLPWFLYFPAIGAGIIGRAVSPGMEMARASFLTHAFMDSGWELES